MKIFRRIKQAKKDRKFYLAIYCMAIFSIMFASIAYAALEADTGVSMEGSVSAERFYYVKFNKNDASATGKMQNQKIGFDVPTNLSRNLFQKDGYKFVEWNTDEHGVGISYEDQQEVINLTTEESITLYAQWKELTKATFKRGRNVNAKMKQLAGNPSATEGSINSNIKYIKRSSTIPPEYKTENNKVSTADSQFPIYMWFDGSIGTIYYYSEADTLYLNYASSCIFQELREVIEIETNFKTDDVEYMEQMFWRCFKLTFLYLSKFNTENVTSMRSMFSQCESIPSFDLSNFNTSNVTNMNYLFNECKKIESLDVSSFDTSKVTTMHHMFSSCIDLKALDLSNFNTSKVTDMKKMFDDLNRVTFINVSSFNT